MGGAVANWETGTSIPLGDCGVGNMQNCTGWTAQLSLLGGGEAYAKSTALPEGIAKASPDPQRSVVVGPGGTALGPRFASLVSASGGEGEAFSVSGRPSSSASSSSSSGDSFAPVVDELPFVGLPPVVAIIVVSTASSQTVSGTRELLSLGRYPLGRVGTCVLSNGSSDRRSPTCVSEWNDVRC